MINIKSMGKVSAIYVLLYKLGKKQTFQRWVKNHLKVKACLLSFSNLISRMLSASLDSKDETFGKSKEYGKPKTTRCFLCNIYGKLIYGVTTIKDDMIIEKSR